MASPPLSPYCFFLMSRYFEKAPAERYELWKKKRNVMVLLEDLSNFFSRILKELSVLVSTKDGGNISLHDPGTVTPINDWEILVH